MTVVDKLILHVEDNPELHDLVQYILTSRPHIKLITAMSVKEAVSLARAHQPDLILMDIHLPDGTGTEALELLRNYPETKDIPAVALSSLATQMQIDEALKEGFKYYITKPIDVPEMLGAIDRILDPSIET